jgi:Tol biopolymer transport system component
MLLAADTPVLAYVDLEQGNGDIILLDVARSLSLNLTDHFATDSGPRWLPDGQTLLFRSDRGGTPAIFQMDVRSRSVWRVAGSASLSEVPAWSPDMSHVLTVTRQTGDFAVYLTGARIGPAPTPADLLLAAGRSPAWSPDGMHIALRIDLGGQSDIYMMDADGSNVRRLTNDPADDVDPTWSPDGCCIAFVSGRDAGRVYGVYLITLATGTITRLSPSGGETHYYDPAWVPGSDDMVVQSQWEPFTSRFRRQTVILDPETAQIRPFSEQIPYLYQFVWRP